MNRKHDISVYNVLFPPYLLLLFPSIWLLVLPANFLIDSAVILLALSFMRLSRMAIYKKTILKVWLFGFLSDFIGSVSCYVLLILFDNLSVPWAHWNTVTHGFTAIFGVVLAGICIYHFNLKLTFKTLDISLVQKKHLALILAIFTAPYLFLVPTSWLY